MPWFGLWQYSTFALAACNIVDNSWTSLSSSFTWPCGSHAATSKQHNKLCILFNAAVIRKWLYSTYTYSAGAILYFTTYTPSAKPLRVVSQLDVCIPKSFIIDSIDKVYRDIIKSIKIDKEELVFYFLTDDEIDNIISNIPASLTTEILDFIKINEEINKINIITENKKIGLTGIPLNVFDKSMFLFIKSIFNEDLINFYEMQYVLISKMNITYDHFLKMNMNECRIFINFYNRDMKKQQEEQSKSSSSMSMPSFSMPSFPKLK